MNELKSSGEAQEWLAGNEGLSWIASSSLHLRAFYWGLYCGSGLKETEETRQSLLARMVSETMFVKPADDPFKLTELYGTIERVRVQLHRTIDVQHRDAARALGTTEEDTADHQGLQPVAILFKPILDCVGHLDEKRAYHRDIVRDALERARNASASEALQTLENLGESFRILAVGTGTAE